MAVSDRELGKIFRKSRAVAVGVGFFVEVSIASIARRRKIVQNVSAGDL